MAQQLMYVPIQAKACGRPHQTCSKGGALPSRRVHALSGASNNGGELQGGWAPGDRGREWAEGKEWPDSKEWPGGAEVGNKKSRTEGGRQLAGGSALECTHVHCNQAPGSGCCTCALPAGWGRGVVCSGASPAAGEEPGTLASGRAESASPCSCGLEPLGVRGPAELAFDVPLALRVPRCSPAGAAAPAAAAAELAPAAVEPAAAEAAAAAELAAASCFSLSRRRWAPAMAAASSAVPCRGDGGSGVAGRGRQGLKNCTARQSVCPDCMHRHT